MFTGIVAEMGRVQTVTGSATGRRLVIDAGRVCDGLDVGDSIAVNGVCLTAVEVDPGRFAVDVVNESLTRSNLGNLGEGDRVDLERPMGAGGRFDGHIVQGHVDAVGVVLGVSEEGDARRMRIAVPDELARYVVEKGSITVDGVSLTVTAVAPTHAPDAWFEVVLIPHTLEVTVLGGRRVGEQVNLEADVIAKYVERLMEARK
jgi:riboflavin synthase